MKSGATGSDDAGLGHRADDPGGGLDKLLQGGLPALLESCRHGRQVIKQDWLFVVSDLDGRLYRDCHCGTGLYRSDTRHLNGWLMQLEHSNLTLLSSSTEKNYLSQVEFMNGHLILDDGTLVPQESLHLSCSRLIAERICERLVLVNYNPFPISLSLKLTFTADFADMFEVRGGQRPKRGQFQPVVLDAQRVVLGYLGLDGALRQTRIGFDRHPETLAVAEGAGFTGAEVVFRLHVGAGGGQAALEFWVSTLQGDEEVAAQEASRPLFRSLSQRLSCDQTRRRDMYTHLVSDNEIYNLVLQRSLTDLDCLTAVLPDTGPYVMAGIPWYACPFGRDALITAYQSLLLGPELAKGTLRYLAHRQGRNLDDFRDEEPGKILHEVRFGELAQLREVPHSPYYGTIDATPLFLILVSETYRWTGDLALVKELWEAIEQALMWIDAYGDQDGDGFLEYATRSKLGLLNHCWKDSVKSNIGPDFAIARPPIAVIEVQGYVYDAKRRMAELCDVLDLRVMGDRLLREAEALKQAFNETFWLPDHNFYALALDGDKRPIKTLGSNVGHCLWSGVIAPERVRTLVAQLLGPDMFSGWGIRTMSAAMPPYNPLSYHNGSVWPHDNSLIAKGLSQHGYVYEALCLMESLYQAALQFPYYRLPELFCGFPRSGELDRPVPYPVACAPQAWASGASFLLLQSILGLCPDAAKRQLIIKKPTLPNWLNRLNLTGLRVGDSTLDLQFVQASGVTSARVMSKSGGPIKVLIEG